ncbi:hypothetical protein ACXHXG_30250 [Rhizobium sp. LEGMi198b]|nr:MULTISPECIES: hypothetical protein [Rhizobium]UWU20531.1 hypothetical protein N2601_14775 [Rhizobium tropici]WFU01331.1 hypothetical protein QA648_14490 [Rhizobium sp. CB3171]
METFLQHCAQEHGLFSAAPFVEWRHGYAFFPQFQRFHAAEWQIA